MNHVEVFVTGLLLAVAALGALACRLSVPYPIMLVIGGAAIGFIPGLPEIRLEPELVLALFLPPLLYKSAIYANFDDFRTNLRGLTLSTVVLVLVTMTGVAAAAHTMIPGMSWQTAFVLGAILSPTDPVAAGTIMHRLNAPRRLVSSIEGEGLFNDATALVAYRVAVAATVAGAFSLAEAGLRFVFGVVVGVAIGVAVGLMSAWVRRHISDPQISVTISLLTGYAAFLPAQAVDASGVLATVAAGIVMAIRSPEVLDARPRLQGYFVWDIVDFLINATLFVMTGLQLRAIVGGLGDYSPGALAVYALVVTAAVVLIRLAWFFTVPSLTDILDKRSGRTQRHLSASWRMVMAWSGMRGAVSLAVALAIPLTVGDGSAFPSGISSCFSRSRSSSSPSSYKDSRCPPWFAGSTLTTTRTPTKRSGPGWSPPRRRWPRSRRSTGRTGPGATPPSACAASTNTGLDVSRRGWARSRTTATRTGRRLTRRWCGWSCRRSGTRWSRCAEKGGFPTRY